jgi:hypothetical protein
MNSARLALAALLITGCAGAPDAAQQPRVEEASLIKAAPQTKRYALVSPEWGLFAAPKQDTLAIPPRWTGERGRGEGRGLFRALRYMGEHAGWVALETIPRDEVDALGTCYDALNPLSSFRLRLYVPRDALATVNAQRVRQEHPDGTWLELAAGVALLPDEQQPGRFTASLNDLLVPLQLDPSLTSTSFEPAALTALEPDKTPPAQLSSLAAEAIQKKLVTVGGEALYRLPRGNQQPAFNERFRDQAPATPEHITATLDRGCARIRVLAPQAHIKPMNALMGFSMPGTNKRALQSGTPLFWSDGRPAGEVIHTYPLPQTPRIVPDLRMECFSPAPNITLCRKLDAK